jgi:hypothetical protein
MICTIQPIGVDDLVHLPVLMVVPDLIVVPRGGMPRAS